MISHKTMMIFMVLLFTFLLVILWIFILHRAVDQGDPLLTSCGCIPEFHEKTYGVQPFEYSTKSDPWWEAEDRSKYFNIISRIGYYIFELNNNGDLIKVDNMELHKEFVKTAHVYGTRVDIVVGFNRVDKDKPLACSRLFVDTCVKSIVAFILKYDFDGVTVDIGGLAQNQDISNVKPFIKMFMETLDQKLNHPKDEERAKRYFINISILDETKPLLDTYTLQSIETLDIIIFPVSDENDEEHPFDFFVDKDIEAERMAYLLPYKFEGEESDIGINYMFEKGDSEKLKLKYNIIVGALRSRVAFWLLEYSKTWEKFDKVFERKLVHTNVESDFIFKRLMTKFIPSLCQALCPYRKIEWLVFGIVTSIYIIFLIVSFIQCDVKAFRERHRIVIYIIGLLLFIIFYIILLCDPTWEGDRYNALVLMIFLLFGLVVRCGIQKKLETDVP